jgi:hypothetical protein
MLSIMLLATIFGVGSLFQNWNKMNNNTMPAGVIVAGTSNDTIALSTTDSAARCCDSICCNYMCK